MIVKLRRCEAGDWLASMLVFEGCPSVIPFDKQKARQSHQSRAWKFHVPLVLALNLALGILHI